MPMRFVGPRMMMGIMGTKMYFKGGKKPHEPRFMSSWDPTLTAYFSFVPFLVAK